MLRAAPKTADSGRQRRRSFLLGGQQVGGLPFCAERQVDTLEGPR